MFSSLQKRGGRQINLNREGAAWMKRRYGRILNPSPMLVPDTAERMLQCHHEVLGIPWSYGGYLEDRSVIWKGSYLDKGKKYIHLGVDFNIPLGTPIELDESGEVVLVDTDTSIGGWGTRIMVRLANRAVVLIYAHLDTDVQCKAGDDLKRGHVLGRVGPPARNGYWYPHLHVQAMTPKAFKRFQEQPEWLDGYCASSEVRELEQCFPDPMPYVRLP